MQSSACFQIPSAFTQRKIDVWTQQMKPKLHSNEKARSGLEVAKHVIIRLQRTIIWEDFDQWQFWEKPFSLNINTAYQVWSIV